MTNKYVNKFPHHLAKNRFLFLCDKFGLKVTPTYKQLTVIASTLKNASGRSRVNVEEIEVDQLQPLLFCNVCYICCIL